MKIAISGKGGVGKTTAAAGLAFLFREKGSRVWAVDADPDANLGWMLGFSEDQLQKLLPLSEQKEEIEKRIGRGPFFTINPEVDDLLEKNTLQQENIYYLKMGGIKEGGSSCYCPENALLRAVLSNLLFDQDDVVILDMAAGIEHLTRGTAKAVDAVFIVVEPSHSSINTAFTILELTRDLGIERVEIIGNKISSPDERKFISSSLERPLIGVLPFSREVYEMGLQKKPIFPTSYIKELGSIIEKW